MSNSVLLGVLIVAVLLIPISLPNKDYPITWQAITTVSQVFLLTAFGSVCFFFGALFIWALAFWKRW